MELAIAVVGLALAGLWWSRRRALRPKHQDEPRSERSDVPDPGVLDPADVADLEALFDGVDQGEAVRRVVLLESRLRPVVERRVPVRAIEPVPGLHVSRMRFADGTTVVVRGFEPGDVAVLASVIRKRTVLAGACASDARGTHLDFDVSGGRRTMSLLVTGLDQPE
jgi:hypothetical protein